MLLAEAVRALGTEYVFGEVSDPERYVGDPSHEAEAWRRVELFQRWGARAVAARYIQPCLGEGLERDRALRLLMFPDARPLPASVRGEKLAEFIDEFYAVTEGTLPTDPELVDLKLAFRGPIDLVELRRPCG
jgi:hypothetical protein